jgi:hypothetical protein
MRANRQNLQQDVPSVSTAPVSTRDYTQLAVSVSLTVSHNVTSLIPSGRHS